MADRVTEPATTPDPHAPPTRAVTAETKRWQDAATQIAPARSYERLVENGRFLITTVSTVGVLITGFGLLGADRLSTREGPKILAATAVGFAVPSILLALWPLVARRRDVNLDNLAEVKAFYNAGLRKGGVLTAAGWLLGIAVGCAGSAGSWGAVLAAQPGPIHTAEQITYLADHDGAQIHALATVTGLRAGTSVTMTVTAGDGARRTTIAAGSADADASGQVSWNESVAAAAWAVTFTLTVGVAGHSTVGVSTGTS